MEGVSAPVENIEVSLEVDGHSSWIDKRAVNRVSPMVRSAFVAVTSHRRDNTRLQIDFPHAPVPKVGHMQAVSGHIQGECCVEHRLGGGPAIARQPRGVFLRRTWRKAALILAWAVFLATPILFFCVSQVST